MSALVLAYELKMASYSAQLTELQLDKKDGKSYTTNLTQKNRTQHEWFLMYRRENDAWFASIFRLAVDRYRNLATLSLPLSASVQATLSCR
jgi:hypothetical protein